MGLNGLMRALIVLLLLAASPLVRSASPAEVDVRQAWQLLEYIAVDYAGAVRDGEIIHEGEYAEMREFASTAAERVASLPPTADSAALVAATKTLSDLVERRAVVSEVADAAHSLANDLFSAYDIVAAPAQAPDMAKAGALYATHCASCHGATGEADGVAAAGMDPPPIAFTDPARAAQRSPLALYEVITQGLQGTEMMSYASLSDSQRWSLAFHVAGMAYGAADRARGEQLWNSDAQLHAALPSLEALSGTSQAQLTSSLAADQARAILAYLRANPAALLPTAGDDASSLAIARGKLAASLDAYQAGDAKKAQSLALAAYLDGVEPIEPMLAVRDAVLLRELEAAMARMRAALRDRAPLDEVQTRAGEVDALFDRVDDTLQGSGADATAAFLGSFTILVREGLEALLIVIAMIAFLRRAGRRDALRWVHGGWIVALLAGAATWAVATWLIDISGAQRELTEGLSALFAALVLLSVGIWMHQKSMAGRWQEYLKSKLAAAMNARSAMFLFLLSFVAVYREVFETILFYVAMWNPQDAGAIIAGFVAGAVVLAFIAFAMLRLGMRLPIGTFFAASSVLIAILAVVLVGKGVAALQEAGWVAEHLVSGPRIDLLGIYPTWQTLLAQLAVAVVAVAGFWFNSRGTRTAAQV